MTLPVAPGIAEPPARVRDAVVVGFRAKAALWMLPVLSLVHLGYAYWTYREFVHDHAVEADAMLAQAPEQFRAVIASSAESLGSLAIQIVATVRTRAGGGRAARAPPARLVAHRRRPGARPPARTTGSEREPRRHGRHPDGLGAREAGDGARDALDREGVGVVDPYRGVRHHCTRASAGIGFANQ